jgi:hypothetical protein
MSTETTAVNESELLSRAIQTIDRADLNRVALVFSQLRLPDSDLDRADELLERNRSGTITGDERFELEQHLRVGLFLDLIRARALRELGRPS